MRTWWSFWALAVLAVGCAAEKAPPGPPAKRVRQVKTWVVERESVDVTRSYLVTLAPWQKAGVLSRASGYVLAWEAERGDPVTKGQRLALVERGVLTEQQTQSAARLTASLAARKQADDTLRRAQALSQGEYIARAELDAATTALQVADAQVAAARAELEMTRTNLGYTEIVAPFDGVVLERRVEVGTLVGPQGPALFEVGEVVRLKAEASVPQPDVPRLAVGAAVELAVEGFAGRSFAGAITRLAPALETSTRTLPVEIGVDNPEGALRPGMFGRATLRIDRVEAAILAPPSAVTRHDGNGGAFVVRDDRAVAVVLELGRTLPDGRVEVLGGLADGDVLIVAGRELVSDGAEVKAVGGPK